MVILFVDIIANMNDVKPGKKPIKRKVQEKKVEQPLGFNSKTSNLGKKYGSDKRVKFYLG